MPNLIDPMIPTSRHPHRFRRQLLLLLALALLAWCVAALAIDDYGLRDRAQPADAIVVLGARVLPGGTPGASLARRADHAAALYRQGLAPVIVCSGGVEDAPPSEAAAACARIAAQGVPSAALVLEERAQSTEENALYVAALMRARGWRSAIVVSDGYHLYRAQLLFAQAGVIAYPSPAQATAGPMTPFERFARALREALALAWYWAKTWLGLPVTDFPCVLQSC
jgi:uncharacterized SAM-binding protein YcdF (DUF218 family)